MKQKISFSDLLLEIVTVRMASLNNLNRHNIDQSVVAAVDGIHDPSAYKMYI